MMYAHDNSCSPDEAQRNPGVKHKRHPCLDFTARSCAATHSLSRDKEWAENAPRRSALRVPSTMPPILGHGPTAHPCADGPESSSMKIHPEWSSSSRRCGRGFQDPGLRPTDFIRATESSTPVDAAEHRSHGRNSPSGCALGARTRSRHRGEPQSGERAYMDVCPGLSSGAGCVATKVPSDEPVRGEKRREPISLWLIGKSPGVLSLVPFFARAKTNWPGANWRRPRPVRAKPRDGFCKGTRPRVRVPASRKSCTRQPRDSARISRSPDEVRRT